MVASLKIPALTVLLFLDFGAKIEAANKDAEVIRNEKGEIAFPDDLSVRNYAKQNFMVHHHDHDHPAFYHYHHHHHHVGDEEDDEDFKGRDYEDQGDDLGLNSTMQIPLDYIKNLNNFNLSDLLLNFVEGEEVSIIQNRFGDEGQERSAATMPKGAECMPELKTVKIAASDDPSILYIPQCTRIERCGGCCKHELLSCQPTKQDNIPFKVYKTQYTGEKKLKFLGTELVMVEKHSECKCRCRVKPEDCTRFQEYKESECRCACINHDERKKCAKYGDKKLWNPELCTCQCRETIMCSTGSFFDQNDCRCAALPKRRYASFERRNYRSEIASVIPLDDEK